MKKIVLFFLFTSSVLYAQQAYYNGFDFSQNGNDLKDDLATLTISEHSNFLDYFERHNYLYDADEDLNNTANVILMYSGESRDEHEYLSGSNSHSPQTFNTEHVYPRSLISGTSEADLHHLRSCDISVNSTRGNQPFASGSGTYGNVSGGWYPGDDWRGDVARMIMYLNLRYNEPFNDVGNLTLFLQWNAVDPVSAIEDQRNNVIESAQGNRNPFIDNPYLATKIWGGDPAEDRWGTLGTEDILNLGFNIYPIPTKDKKITIESNSELINSVELYTLTGQLILEKNNLQKKENTFVLDNLPTGFYVLRVHSEKGMASKKVIVN